MEAQPGPPMHPGSRPSYVLVGGILVAVVVALVIAGIVLSQRSHAAPQAQAVARPSASIIVAPTTSTSAAVSLSGTASSSSVASASASASIGGLAVANTPLEQAVEAAYLHYWDVRTQAYRTLDTSHLSEVMAGAELARAEKQIADLRSQHREGKLDVQHRIALVNVTPDKATVTDEYLNRSVFVDASTGKDIATSAPPETEKVSYQLQNIAGIWKVVDGAQFG